MTTEVTDTTGQDALLREHELADERSQETHYFKVQTELETHFSKGSVKRVDSYLELLKVEPGNCSAGDPDRFTWARFYVQRGDDPKVKILSLEGFSYEVNKELLDQFELDEKGQKFWVPENKFEDLAYQTRAKLSIDARYQVYSAFFYYDVSTSYAEPTSDGNGVQYLKEVGDKVVHVAAFIESPLPGKRAWLSPWIL